MLEALVEFLRNFAGPTGERASILLMSGGLVVLGFLFLIFIFRSAIVGDLAPTANVRAVPPVALRPPDVPPQMRAPAGDAFAAGRTMGRKAPADLEEALDAMAGLGLGDPRILDATAQTMRVRLYARGQGGCDAARGYLVGVLENLLGAPVKADEAACRHSGSEHCEFDVRHPVRTVKH